MPKLAWPFMLVAVTGCSGQVWHQPATSLRTGEREKGIVYYDRFLAQQHYNFTKHVGSDGKEDGIPCRVTVAYTQIVPMVDYGRPNIIYFEPGFLESYKFNPQIAVDGTLSSANIESTPDRGEALTKLTEAAGNIAKLGLFSKNVKPPPPPKLSSPNCNAGPILFTFKKVDMQSLQAAPLPQPTVP